MNSIIGVSIVLSLAIITIIYFFNYGISHIIDYYPGDDGINFILFTKIKFFILKYIYINTCTTYSLFDGSWFDGHLSTAFRTLNIGGWPRLTRVMLQMNKGPFINIFLFPRDPVLFAQKVQNYLVARSQAEGGTVS